MNNELIWQQYVAGKQTYAQLASAFGCSIKTIQRHLDMIKVKQVPVLVKQIVVLMDTTYFGRIFGVMLFKDAYSGKNLYKQYVKNETNQLYWEGITYLKDKGFTINAIVCDGRKGLFRLFGNVPMQMCQFHQTAIITRYLTRKPKHKAGKELRSLTLLLVRTDKESFVGGLNQWHIKWESYLNERTKNAKTNKSH